MDHRPVILHLDPATLATAAEVWRHSESRGVASRSETYAHLSCKLRRFVFWKRRSADKGLLRAYLQLSTWSRGSRPCARACRS